MNHNLHDDARITLQGERMSAVGQIKTQSLKTRVLASIFPLVKWYTPVRQSGSKSTA